MPKRSYPFSSNTTMAKRRKITARRRFPRKTYKRNNYYKKNNYRRRRYYGRKRKPNLMRLAKAIGTITKELTITNLTQMKGAFTYTGGGTVSGAVIDFGPQMNKLRYMLGNNVENYKIYTRLDDYSEFYTKRITTKLCNFRVVRVYRREWLDAASKERIYRENTEYDKDNIEILYFRDKFGVGLPGAFTTPSNADWVELCERKIFRSRHHGIYYTTHFRTKNERMLASCAALKTAMKATSTSTTKEDLFPILGLKSKTTSDNYKDVHSVNVAIGRYDPVPSQYFNDVDHKVAVKRTIKEYLEFDYITYITVCLSRPVQ